jgi:hypothetical protein
MMLAYHFRGYQSQWLEHRANPRFLIETLLTVWVLVASLPAPAIERLESRTLEPGLLHHRFRHQGTLVNVLEADMSKGLYTLKPALAEEGDLWQRDSVVEMASRRGAVAAINAGYFRSDGMPIGAIAIDREWITSPVMRRAAIGVLSDNSIGFAQPEVSGIVHLRTPSGRQFRHHLRITGINQPLSLIGDGIGLFNHWWNRPLACGGETACLKVDRNGNIRHRVTAHSGIATDFTPSDDGFVLASQSYGALAGLKEDQSIDIVWQSDPPYWSEIRHALGAGPYLVRDGRIVLHQRGEGFDLDSGIFGEASRSAVGLSRSGRLVLVTVDGIRGFSGGLKLRELAKLLKSIGIRDAINLDGGGSSIMVYGERILNRPSSGSPRPVSTGLLLLRHYPSSPYNP